MAAWAQLPNDLLFLIGKKLDVVTDRFRFRSVCNSWRSSLPPFPQPPLLLLSESSHQNKNKKENEKGNNINPNQNPPPPPLRRFVGIGGEQQLVYEFCFPEAHQQRCVGSTGNWLITIDKSGMIYLLNPFSRAQIHLPPQSTFEYGFHPEVEDRVTPEHRRDLLLSKVIISSPLSKSHIFTTSSKDCIAIAIHNHPQRLAIARLGDTTWTTLNTPVKNFEDIILFKEQFYAAVTYHGVVMVCNIGVDLHTPKISVLTERWPRAKLSIHHQKYLVELMGELLMIIKFVNDPSVDPDDREACENILLTYKTENFEVYKLDFTNKKWEQVDNLGKYCLFLGFNTSISLLADNYFGLQENCIYFTDDYTFGYGGRKIPGGRDMGVFNLKDKSIQPHYKGESTCYYSPPIWLVPTPVK